LLALIALAVFGLGALMLVGLLGHAAGGGRSAVNSDLIVHPGEQVTDVTVANGDIRILAGAVVQGDVTVQSGEVTVEGQVGGNVSSLQGDIILRPTADVAGNVLASAGNIYRQPGARVGGHLTATAGAIHNEAVPAARPPGGPSGVVAALVRFLMLGLGSVVVLGLGMAGLFAAPPPVTRIEGTLEEVFWPSAVVGLLTAILLPVAAALLGGVLLFTVIGTPLVLLAAAGIWFLGLVVFGLWLGDRLARVFPRARLARTSVGRGTLGLAAILLVGWLFGGGVLWVGWLLVYLLGCLGLGAVILSRGGSIALVRDSRLPFGLSRITGPLGGDPPVGRKAS
jgi:cytoskeletal protein CcmA (bactofilin family)